MTNDERDKLNRKIVNGAYDLETPNIYNFYV